MRVIVKVRTSKVGSECVDEFDLTEGDFNEREIEEAALETVFSMIE